MNWLRNVQWPSLNSKSLLSSRKFWLNETIAILYWSSAYSSKELPNVESQLFYVVFLQQNYLKGEMGRNDSLHFLKEGKQICKREMWLVQVPDFTSLQVFHAAPPEDQPIWAVSNFCACLSSGALSCWQVRYSCTEKKSYVCAHARGHKYIWRLIFLIIQASVILWLKCVLILCSWWLPWWLRW